MSAGFDARKDCTPLRRAMGAYIETLLVELLPPMRLAARGCGYAIAVHGSLQRDIDLVAIPWTVNPTEPEVLVQRLVGVIAGVCGRAHPMNEWSDKPHGRKAVTIITCGDAEVDLSIMPRTPPPDHDAIPSAEGGSAQSQPGADASSAPHDAQHEDGKEG